MKQQPYIDNELKSIAPFLAGMEKNYVFYVPEDYFLTFGAKILEKIKSDHFEILPASKPPSFTLPDGYFDNLAGNILAKIKSLESDDAREELKNISPVLYSVPGKNVFTVPEGYFQGFPHITLNMVKPLPKVVAMKKKSFIWSCAAAAMIAGIMAISALWTTNDFVQQSTVVAYNKSTLLDIRDASQYKNDQEINDAIANVPDADIVKYLESTGSNADDEALAADISEKDLPNEQDYLNDENTLYRFLGKTSLKNNN